jgi:B-box zinc finger
MKRKSCELCNAIASVYCAADSAFLCSSCDEAVHGANFLVARHVRWTHCLTCGCLLLISGPGSDPPTRLCRACRSSPTQACSSSHSDASSCASTAESKKRRREETPRSRLKKTKRGRSAREREAADVVWRVAREEEGWAESD